MWPHGWIAVAILAAVFWLLQGRRRVPTDLLFMSALVGVTVTGVITPAQALSGFSNPAAITVASLFVVAAGLRSTGVLDWLGERLLGSAHSPGAALRRLALAILPGSAVIINTPIVAMLMPVALEWCRRREISPSRILIPISYLTILGGVCTLIGTSTTLIINGMLRAEYDEALAAPARYAPEFTAQLVPMSFLEPGKVGVFCALVGGLYVVLVLRRTLPDRTDLVEKLGEQRREYLVEMLVQPGCRLVGQTVEAAGLRQLPGLFLIEISRADESIAPVTPNDTIREDDRLVFTGVVSTIVDLERIPGLVPAADTTFEFHPRQRHRRHMTEAVISNSSPLVNRTVRETNFRELYNAAIVAVHRNGRRLPKKVGDIRLAAGDTLLLQTRTGFVETYRHSPDFYLVSDVDSDSPRRHDRAILSGLLMVLLIVWLSIGSFIAHDSPLSTIASPAIAGIAIAGAMILTRTITVPAARRAIDLQVYLTIVGALALGRALTESGVAARSAQFIVGLVESQAGADTPFAHYLLLIAIYLLAMFFTELVTNNAVAAMLFPLSVAIAQQAGVSPRPFVMAIAMAASLAFLTPIGYQTNLMVMGPGGYRPRDYLRAGWPLSLLTAITALIVIPIAFPF